MLKVGGLKVFPDVVLWAPRIWKTYEIQGKKPTKWEHKFQAGDFVWKQQNHGKTVITE